MESQILKAIAESLLQAGSCPCDAACRFGRGNQCNASKAELEAKLKGIINNNNSKPNYLAFENTEKPSPWRCENIGIVQFVDPEEDD